MGLLRRSESERIPTVTEDGDAANVVLILNRKNNNSIVLSKAARQVKHEIT